MRLFAPVPDAHGFALARTVAPCSCSRRSPMRTVLHSLGPSRHALVRASPRCARFCTRSDGRAMRLFPPVPNAHGFALARTVAPCACSRQPPMRTHLQRQNRHPDSHAPAPGHFASAPKVQAPCVHPIDGPNEARKTHGEYIPKVPNERKRKGRFYASNVMTGGRGKPSVRPRCSTQSGRESDPDLHRNGVSGREARRARPQKLSRIARSGPSRPTQSAFALRNAGLSRSRSK